MTQQRPLGRGGRDVQRRLAKGANVVVLDPDMAKVLPTSKALNDALRVLAEAGRRRGKVKGSTQRVAKHFP
jgi:hypothetical protein